MGWLKIFLVKGKTPRGGVQRPPPIPTWIIGLKIKKQIDSSGSRYPKRLCRTVLLCMYKRLSKHSKMCQMEKDFFLHDERRSRACMHLNVKLYFHLQLYFLDRKKTKQKCILLFHIISNRNWAFFCNIISLVDFA